MNDLSAEALLARFFDVSVLRSYCEDRLGVTGKGNEATLAAKLPRRSKLFYTIGAIGGESGGRRQVDEEPKYRKKTPI
jgi:hypothetical protein